MFVGVLTHYTFLHSLYDLKTVQMNMQHSLIQEFMLYKFKLGHNSIETTKNITCVKGEGAVDHSIVTRWFKKFHLSCKNLDDQARSDRPKTQEPEAMLQALEANLMNSTQKASDNLGISQFTEVCHINYRLLSTFSLRECGILVILVCLMSMNELLYCMGGMQLTVVS